MTGSDRCHGENGDEICDLPIVGNERCYCEDDHSGDADEGERHREFELLQHLGNFNEEVTELGFLGSGTPCHVNLEHVR